MSSVPNEQLLTIGHSNHSPAHFQRLLSENQVDVLVDVRSWPHSKHVEWADQARLPSLITAVGAKYLFLGDQLGGRPEDSSCYDDEGYVLYWKVAQTDSFRAGIQRLRDGLSRVRVAIMCSEEDPTNCHRRLLVAKVMLEQGIGVVHVRGDGCSEVEAGPIRLSAGALFEDEEALWRSSRSVSRKRPPRTSLAA